MKTQARDVTAAFLFVICLATVSLAQKTRQATPTANPANDLLAALPQSDAVALIKVQLLFDEALPRILTDNPAKQAEVNGEVEKFKTRTGINARSFDQLALGMRYSYPREGVTRVDTVALARGSFSTADFTAAGRAAPGKYREEKYRGLTIYIFTLEQQIKVLGLLNIQVHNLAVAALGSNLLALGTPGNVKVAIDAGKGPRGLNRELVALATLDPNAAVGFGGNLTPQLIQSMNAHYAGLPEDVAKIQQVYGSVNISEKDVALLLAARSLNAGAARSLSLTVETLTQLATLFVGKLPPAKGAVARAALSNLKITTQGNEIRITTAVTHTQLGSLLR